MNRSGYVDDLGSDDPLAYGRWRAQVNNTIHSKRVQAFLRELIVAMDATPPEHRRLICNELINAEGDCCTIGVVCKSRGIDVASVDVHEPTEVGALVGIAHQMASEIEFENDEGGYEETPEMRWWRMRRWAERRLVRDWKTAIIQVLWQNIANGEERQFVAQSSGFTSKQEMVVWINTTINEHRRICPRGWSALVVDSTSKLFDHTGGVRVNDAKGGA